MDLTSEELALVIEALEAAAMWQDARSRVIDSAARRSARRYPDRAAEPAAGRDAGRGKAQEYAELAALLKRRRNEADPVSGLTET